MNEIRTVNQTAVPCPESFGYKRIKIMTKILKWAGLVVGWTAF